MQITIIKILISQKYTHYYKRNITLVKHEKHTKTTNIEDLIKSNNQLINSRIINKTKEIHKNFTKI